MLVYFVCINVYMICVRALSWIKHIYAQYTYISTHDTTNDIRRYIFVESYIWVHFTHTYQHTNEICTRSIVMWARERQKMRRHAWVMWRANESCHIPTSHVAHQWVMSHINESCHIWISHVTCEWVMLHINDSFHILMRHVMHERDMSHINKSCHTWMSHVTYQ